MKNQVQLIVYVDRLPSRGDFDTLRALLRGPLQGLFGGVHLLPFYDPIDGADAGFDPVDHTAIDVRLGDWSDLAALAREVDVMADVIVNHVSSASPAFRDYLAQGDASPHAGLFLSFDRVFPRGADAATLKAIYRPRPGPPFTTFTLASGETKTLWTTFTAQQVDIDVEHPQGIAYLDSVLDRLASHGVRLVRLDAVGYAIKRAGTRCFMLPETDAFIAAFAARCHARGLEVLVEIHGHWRQQVEIARRVDYVYDFALPPLVLHALHFGTAGPLKRWLAARPANALTVLDTHDGIGIIDIGAAGDAPGLVPPDELDRLVEGIHAQSGGASRRATGAAASNLDLYQVNCTYYDALGRDDRAYWIARAIQFFVPGIPQVYYVGLLAGGNDMALLRETGVGRDINRQRFAIGEAEAALRRPAARELLRLIRLRNDSPAFSGRFRSLPVADHAIALEWTHGDDSACLTVDFRNHAYAIELVESGVPRAFRFELEYDDMAPGEQDVRSAPER